MSIKDEIREAKVKAEKYYYIASLVSSINDEIDDLRIVLECCDNDVKYTASTGENTQKIMVKTYVISLLIGSPQKAYKRDTFEYMSYFYSECARVKDYYDSLILGIDEEYDSFNEVTDFNVIEENRITRSALYDGLDEFTSRV